MRRTYEDALAVLHRTTSPMAGEDFSLVATWEEALRQADLDDEELTLLAEDTSRRHEVREAADNLLYYKAVAADRWWG